MKTVNPAVGYIDRSRATQLVEKWSPVRFVANELFTKSEIEKIEEKLKT